MATIVNTPAASHEHVAEGSDSNSMLNLIIGVVVILILAALFFYVGLPLIRNAGGTVPQQVNNYAPPQQGNQAPQINVPDKINVDVNNPGAQAPK